MNFKRIPVITEMKINTLNCVRTYCGEYETKIDIAFLLEQKCKFYIYYMMKMFSYTTLYSTISD